MLLIIRRITGINCCPCTTWIKIEAPTHRRQNIKRVFDQSISLFLPELGDTFRLQVADGLIFFGFRRVPCNIALAIPSAERLPE